jgi:hypothetical protein
MRRKDYLMTPKTMRSIAIALVIISLVWTILSLSGRVQSPTYLRTILLVIAVILLIMARRSPNTPPQR